MAARRRDVLATPCVFLPKFEAGYKFVTRDDIGVGMARGQVTV